MGILSFQFRFFLVAYLLSTTSFSNNFSFFAGVRHGGVAGQADHAAALCGGDTLSRLPSDSQRAGGGRSGGLRSRIRLPGHHI